MEFAIAQNETARTDGWREEIAPLLRLAGQLMSREEYETAEGVLRQALARSPEDPACLADMAICLAAGRGRLMSAEKLAAQAIRIAPRHPRAHYALGRVNMLGSRDERARRHLECAHRLDPEDPDIEEALSALDRRRMKPVLSDLAPTHPLNVRLGQIRDFLRKGRSLKI